jgi:hypothetical protein
MDYANKQLIEALQQIAQQEKESKDHPACFSTQIEDVDLDLSYSQGVDNFLRKRAEFRENAKNVNVGVY